PEVSTLSLHDALPILCHRYVSGDDDEDCRAALDALRALEQEMNRRKDIIRDLPVEAVPNGRKVYPHLAERPVQVRPVGSQRLDRSEEHTSELQSRENL